jgi:hypothetical protein
LLDFWITWLTESAVLLWSSRMVEPLMVMVPGAVWITVSGLTMPFCSASDTTSGFIVEPGSKVSVKARLRSCAPLRFWRCAGS